MTTETKPIGCGPCFNCIHVSHAAPCRGKLIDDSPCQCGETISITYRITYRIHGQYLNGETP